MSSLLDDDEYLDLASEAYILSPAEWITRPHQKKELVRQAIMNEFWTRILKRAATFPGCDPSIGNKLYHFNPDVLVLACHIIAGNEKDGNKFNVLSNEAPAPHSSDVQRQLQQLQNQLRTLQEQVHSREPPSHTGGTTRHDIPMQYPHFQSHNGGRPRVQAHGPHSQAPESSSQGAARNHAPSYRPQHDRRTLAPRRQFSPPSAHRPRQSYPPPRWNAWSRQEWRPRSPREDQHNQERTVPHTSSNRGHGYQAPPPQPIERRPENINSHTPPIVEAGGGILPTPSFPQRAPHPLSANHHKRDKRRRNRRALYQELQELVLGNVHVRVRSDGRVHPFYDKITLRLSQTLLQDERYKYLVENLVPKPRQQQDGTSEKPEEPSNNATASPHKDANEKEQVMTPQEGSTESKSQPRVQLMEVDETRKTLPTLSRD